MRASTRISAGKNEPVARARPCKPTDNSQQSPVRFPRRHSGRSRGDACAWPSGQPAASHTSDAMAKAKPRAAGSSSSGTKPAWPRVLTQAKRPTLIVVTLFVMFKWILPYLADLTPPGVDVQLIQAEAVKRAARAKDKCATVCDGMNCPAGWQTGRSPEDHCKCICVRKDPSGHCGTSAQPGAVLPGR